MIKLPTQLESFILYYIFYSKRQSSEKEWIPKEDLRSRESESLSNIHEEETYERRREVIDRPRDEHNRKRDTHHRFRENANERKQVEQDRQQPRQEQPREVLVRRSRETSSERDRETTRDSSSIREEDIKRERRRDVVVMERKDRRLERREKNNYLHESKHRKGQNHIDGMRRHSEDFQTKAREMAKDATTTTTILRSRSRTEEERYYRKNNLQRDRFCDNKEQQIDERKRIKLNTKPTTTAARGSTNRYDSDSPPTRTVKKDSAMSSENFTRPKKNFRFSNTS